MALSPSQMSTPACSCTILLLLLASLVMPTDEWIVPQPKANVWKTLARSLGQDHICLSSSSSTSLMSTCLVRIPFSQEQFPNSISFHQAQANRLKVKTKYVQVGGISYKFKLLVENLLWLWGEWVKSLPEMDKEPQELELMGSLAASWCVQFEYPVLPEYQSEYLIVRQVD